MRLARFWCVLAGLGLSTAALGGDAQWTTAGPLGGRVHEIVFDPTDPAKAYATTNGGVFRSVDGGGGSPPGEVRNPPRVKKLK